MKWQLLSVISAFFLIVGIALPYINEDFPTSVPKYDTEGYISGQGQEIVQGTTDAVDIFLSVVSMFFWTFGALPIYIEFIFLFLRLIFYAILVDLLWIG